MSFEDYLKNKEKKVRKNTSNVRSVIKEGKKNMGLDVNREVIRRIDNLEDKLDLILDTLTEILEGTEEVEQYTSVSEYEPEEELSPLAEMFTRAKPSISNVQQQVHDTTFAAANLFEDVDNLDESAVSGLAKQADVSLLSTASNVPIPAKNDVVDLAGAAAILG